MWVFFFLYLFAYGVAVWILVVLVWMNCPIKTISLLFSVWLYACVECLLYDCSMEHQKLSNISFSLLPIYSIDCYICIHCWVVSWPHLFIYQATTLQDAIKKKECIFVCMKGNEGAPWKNTIFPKLHKTYN